jgi:hypothetical protein
MKIKDKVAEIINDIIDNYVLGGTMLNFKGKAVDQIDTLYRKEFADMIRDVNVELIKARSPEYEQGYNEGIQAYDLLLTDLEIKLGSKEI